MSARLPQALQEQLAGIDNAEADPTHSTTKRQNLEAKFNRRWNEVKGEINDLFSGGSYYHPQNDVSNSQQIADFRDWLEATLASTVLETVRQREARNGNHWTSQYVRQFYEHGLERADTELRQVGYDIPTEVTGEDILRQDQNDLHENLLQEENLAVYQDLEDIVRRTEQEITREYRESVRAGLALGATSNALKDRIDHSRAGKNATRGLAHTRAGVQVINDAALERYHEAGVEQVGATIEVDIDVEESYGPGASSGDIDPNGSDTPDDLSFITAGDLRVCSTCQTYAAGGPYQVEAIRNGTAPMPGRDTHMLCRCLLVPTSAS